MTDLIIKLAVACMLISLIVGVCIACLFFFISQKTSLENSKQINATLHEQSVETTLPLLHPSIPAPQTLPHTQQPKTDSTSNSSTYPQGCLKANNTLDEDFTQMLDNTFRTLSEGLNLEVPNQGGAESATIGCRELLNYWQENGKYINNEDFAYLIERLLADPTEQFNFLHAIHNSEGWAASDLILKLLNDIGPQPGEWQFYRELITRTLEQADVERTLTLLSHIPMPDNGFLENLKKEFDALSESLVNHPNGEIRAYAMTTKFWLSVHNKAYDSAFLEITKHRHDPSSRVRQAIYDNIEAALNREDLNIPAESITFLQTLLNN